MQKLKFSELDLTQMQAVYWLAHAAETVTPTILAGAVHVGELWEAEAFLKHFPPGTEQHAQLANRLRLGGFATETILDCIRRVDLPYRTLAQRGKAELTDLLPTKQDVIVGV